MRVLTQSAYDSLPDKDPNTLYFITDDADDNVSGDDVLPEDIPEEKRTSIWWDDEPHIYNIEGGLGRTILMALGIIDQTSGEWKHNITKVEFGNNVTVVGDYTFLNCDQLSEVDFNPLNAMSGLTRIGQGAFSGCSALTTLNMEVAFAVREIDNEAFKDCAALTTVSLPQALETIGTDIFMGCPNITTVKLPHGILSEGSVRNMFPDAINVIENVTIYPGQEATIDNNTFESCMALTSVEGWSVTSVGNMAFYGCQALTNVDLPSMQSMGAYAFAGCPLTRMELNEGITDIPEQAFGGASLEEINLPTTLTHIGEHAFLACNLRSVEIPSGVTSIGSGAFSTNMSLTSVNLPNNLTAIPDEMFKDCEILQTISIPSSLQTIGREAFAGCPVLEQLDMPIGLNEVGEDAFSGCSALTLNTPKLVVKSRCLGKGVPYERILCEDEEDFRATKVAFNNEG